MLNSFPNIQNPYGKIYIRPVFDKVKNNFLRLENSVYYEILIKNEFVIVFY